MYISEWTQDKRLAGRTGGFFDAVAASMNLSYSVKVPPDFQWGSCLANGTACAGMLGDVFYEVSHPLIIVPEKYSTLRQRD